MLGVFIVLPVYTKDRNCRVSVNAGTRNLKTLYAQLRKADKSCSLLPKMYLEFSDRALMAERYAEALWATQSGIRKSVNTSVTNKLILNQGLAFIGKDRNEEAITVLKKLAIKGSRKHVDARVKKVAHLALIKAYYQKNQSPRNKNVNFLINLYFHRYPDSPYDSILFEWCQDAGFTQTKQYKIRKLSYTKSN